MSSFSFSIVYLMDCKLIFRGFRVALQVTARDAEISLYKADATGL